MFNTMVYRTNNNHLNINPKIDSTLYKEILLANVKTDNFSLKPYLTRNPKNGEYYMKTQVTNIGTTNY